MSKTAAKILTQLKGLSNHLQAAEEPLISIPAIWDGGLEEQRKACDVVLTNQRLLGYVFVTFPRERLFLQSLPLSSITIVSLRQKSFEPLFRELLVGDGQNKVYIRAPRQKIEILYDALRLAIEQYVPSASEQTSFTDQVVEAEDTEAQHPTPAYGRQEIRSKFESSPLAITMLFIGGIVLEVGGALLWSVTQNIQNGLPLFIAGFICVLTATLVRRQRS